jgi:hypothetical protein
MVAKRLAFTLPLLTASMGTMYLGALLIVAGGHGLFCAGAILSREDK